uniref:Uncharacterized protein n=1 Tax=Schistosoma curassoni TaxID=6186 RepID=A0A183JPV8_9TREM
MVTKSLEETKSQCQQSRLNCLLLVLFVGLNNY